ncbi:hypothetical protein L1987_06514 [Smallanthus sonchifolius]|uniref:Uncharacterized protein n=1 Tax=Smallanthus sonchifolius TaxID=185202 RepID=A0ACB9JYE1_9ASTR|nr:hypothetical protein L1987_06514 [Smallanthus sonchifolius]
MLQQCDRLTNLLNELRTKGREYDIDEVLENFLRSLPAQWRMYIISIRNSYDLKNLDMVELHGMLKTYELEMSQDNKIMNNKKGVEVLTQSAVFFIPPTSTTTEGGSSCYNSELSRNEAFMTNGDPEPIEEAHNTFNVSSSDNEYESTSETLICCRGQFMASSLEPIIGPDAQFDLDSFQQTFSHADVGAEGNLFPVNEKEIDIDYKVSFRRPSIDPPFVVESFSVVDASNTNDVAHNTVSNFDTDAEENTKQNIPTDDDAKDMYTEIAEPLIERRINKLRPLENVIAYVYQERKHAIIATMDGKPLPIRTETIRTHLQLADTKRKYSFPDSDVEKNFRDTGYGGNSKPTSQNLADKSKGKKHMTDAPSKKDVSLGPEDSPNTIGKKLPSKPLKSLKRKRSDTSISSSQDEDVPPIPTLEGDNLTEEREKVSNPISPIHEEVAMENNKLLKQILLSLATLLPSPTASIPAKVPTDATKKGENNIVRWFYDQEKKIIFIQREYRKMENLKGYDSQPSNSPRIFSTLDKKWLLQNDLEKAEVPEAQEIQFRIRSIFKETLKRKIEAIDNPEKIHKADESNCTDPVFTSVAAEASSVATEDTLKEKAKGKMPIMEEEEIEKDVHVTTTDDRQSIIPGTNMPLGLAEELARRLYEKEDEAMRKEDAERKLEVYQSRMAAKRNLEKKTWIKMSTLSEMVKQMRNDQIIAQQSISSTPTTSQSSHPAELLKVKIETTEEPKALSPHQSPARIELSTPSPQQTPSPRKDYSTPSLQITISIPSTSRKKMIVIKKRKASVTSWNHVGKRYDAMHRQLDSLSFSESSQEEEDEGKKENFFRNEDDRDSSDNDEFSTDTKMPLAEPQVPISKWYYDQELKRFLIKRLDFTYSVFSELLDLSVISPAELKLLSLMPMSTTTEEGTKLQERIRQSVWTIRGQEDAVPIFLPLENFEMDEKAGKIEMTIKEFAKVYKEANK